MTKTPSNHYVWLYRAAIIFAIGVCLLVVAQQYVAARISDLQTAWQTEWRTQEQALLRALEQPNHTLPAPVVMEPWLERCAATERRDYESTLQDLGSGLSATDLQYLAENFDRCGTVAADQSLAQGVALEQQVARLEQWLQAESFFPDIDSDYYQSRFETWQEVQAQTVAIQVTQYKLDGLQRSLIQARQQGQPVSGQIISDLLSQVNTVRQQLSEETVARRDMLRRLSL